MKLAILSGGFRVPLVERHRDCRDLRQLFDSELDQVNNALDAPTESIEKAM